jgi:glycogen debranching enzyme
MGPFITAYLRVHGNSRAARERAAELLSSVLDLMREKGIGQICEILDGDPPHRPCGCIAQAWSVGEILRAATESLQQIRPNVSRTMLVGGTAV